MESSRESEAPRQGQDAAGGPRRTGRRAMLLCLALALVVLAAQGAIWLFQESLIRRLREDDSVTIVETARRLASMRCARAIPHMIAALESGRVTGYDRGDLITAVADTGAASVPALLELSHRGGYNGMVACRKLGTVGRRSAEALELLLDALDGAYLADHASDALIRIGPPAAIAAAWRLRRIQTGEMPATAAARRRLCEVIGRVTEDERTLDVLRAALDDLEETVREAAARALERARQRLGETRPAGASTI